jgi:hypothetical protein
MLSGGVKKYIAKNGKTMSTKFKTVQNNGTSVRGYYHDDPLRIYAWRRL